MVPASTGLLKTVNTRGVSRAAAMSEMEFFVTIVNDFQQLTIVTKSSNSDIAVVLNTSLNKFGH